MIRGCILLLTWLRLTWPAILNQLFYFERFDKYRWCGWSDEEGAIAEQVGCLLWYDDCIPTSFQWEIRGGNNTHPLVNCGCNGCYARWLIFSHQTFLIQNGNISAKIRQTFGILKHCVFQSTRVNIMFKSELIPFEKPGSKIFFPHSTHDNLCIYVNVIIGDWDRNKPKTFMCLWRVYLCPQITQFCGQRSLASYL